MGKICVAIVVLSFAAGGEIGYTPVSGYSEQDILGWKVLLNKGFSGEHPELASEVLGLLEYQLYQVTRVVPDTALKELRRQNIWVEYEDRNFPCMCYHPSAEWLSKNGYNPEKEGDIEICGARNFLKWTKDQPYMVLHELAHGYHDLVLGYDNSEIRQAYDKAVTGGKYDSVLHINGRKRKAYALNNAKEYFAETAEAYFGTNDFYPFVRSELKEIDPNAYELHSRLWNPPQEVN